MPNISSRRNMVGAIQRQTSTAMTKDFHCQKIVPTECVTPNVPKLRSSFFNRKYRESGGSVGQLTPSTPKAGANKIGNSRSGASATKLRSKRSGAKIDSLGLSSGSGKNTSRPTRSRPNSGEFFETDFSTPRANRASLLTPTSGVTTKRNGKITHFYYKPLELDNESSSESSDQFMRRRHENSQIKLPRTESPLAIEATHAEVTLRIFEPVNSNSSDEEMKKGGSQLSEGRTGNEPTRIADISEDKAIEIIEIDDSDDSQDVASPKNVNSAPPSTKRTRPEQTPMATQSDISVLSQNKKPAKIVEISQCITPPTTPPDKEVVEPVTTRKFSTFIPGNCNIEEVLRMYGRDSSRDKSITEKMETEAK